MDHVKKWSVMADVKLLAVVVHDKYNELGSDLEGFIYSMNIQCL